MPDRTQDLKNHRQVAVACKNYTDTEIKKSEERILSIVARNNVDFIDHINEATYRFTAPLNSKLLMLQSIAGNSNKIAPSTPSDDSVARLKVIPENTYKSQIDYIGGKSVKYNQFLINNESTVTRNGITFTNNGNGTWTVNGTSTARANTAVNLATFKIPVKLNDKIFIIGCPSGGSGSTYYLAPVFYNDGSYVTFDINNIDVGNGKIVTVTNSNVNEVRIEIIGAQSENQTVNNLLFKPELINLTDIFGAGNEPSTVETAIPLLKANGYKLDGTDTYSTGSLKHAITTSVVYSANLMNVSIESGIFGSSGEKASNGRRIRTADKISLSAGTYTISFTGVNSVAVYIYDTNDVLKNTPSWQDTNEFTFTVDYNFKVNFAWRKTTDDFITPSDMTSCLLNKGSSVISDITKAIPSEVLALSGYGMGRSGAYNYIDFNAKKFNANTYTQVFTGLENGWALRSGNSHTFEIPCNRFPIPPKNNLLYRATTETFGWKDLLSPEIDTIDGVYVNTTGTFIVTVMSCSTLAEFQAYLQTHLLALNYDITPVETDVSQYFTDGWNKVDLDNQYATCEMVVDEPIDMPNKVEYYGTIIHALATAVKQDGFNVWDEEWEKGYWNVNTGQSVYDVNYIRCKNFIEIIPNTTYCLGNNTTSIASRNNEVLYFDENQNIIGYDNVLGNSTFTTPLNCAYIKFYMNLNYGGTYNNDICINISNQDLNGTYKPYKASITRLLPNSEAKYSWGITDGVRNTRVFCDDECNPVNEGSLVVGNQDLGLQTWGKTTVFYTTLNDMKPLAQTICNNFETYIMGESLPNYDCIQIRSNKDIYFRYSNDSPYASLGANVFKSSMNGVMLEFEKATTDTETLDDFDFSFDCEEGDTFTIIGCELLQCYATYSFLIKEAKTNE